MRQPPVTTDSHSMFVLVTDPALERPVQEGGESDKAFGERAAAFIEAYGSYRKTGDESLLPLTAEPTRYEIRPLSVRQRFWAAGRTTVHLGIQEGAVDDGGQMLVGLVYARAGLVAVVHPGGERFEVPQAQDLGVLVGTEDGVMGACGDLQTASSVGNHVYQMTEVSESLGKSSASSLKEATKKCRSAPSGATRAKKAKGKRKR